MRCKIPGTIDKYSKSRHLGVGFYVCKYIHWKYRRHCGGGKPIYEAGIINWLQMERKELKKIKNRY